MEDNYCPFDECFLYALPPIGRIAFYDDTTVVYWCDGTKTVVRRGEGEPDSKYTAFTAAVAKKLFGSTSAVKKVIDEYDTEKIKERREAERLEERRKQDLAAKRNHEKRIRKLAKQIRDLKEATDLVMGPFDPSLFANCDDEGNEADD